MLEASLSTGSMTCATHSAKWIGRPLCKEQSSIAFQDDSIHSGLDCQAVELELLLQVLWNEKTGNFSLI